MQRLFILLFFVLSNLNHNSKAQVAIEGVFLSAADFNSDKLSYQKIPGKKYKLNTHDIINTSILKININDSIITLKKDSVFGYRDKENKFYRFYKNTKYQIINPKERSLLLYSSIALGGPKNNQAQINYFFSANANSPIQKLTKNNLKTIFFSNSTFNELLDIYFITDKNLTEYDNYLKIYKLNKIEKLSTQTKINNQ